MTKIPAVLLTVALVFSACSEASDTPTTAPAPSAPTTQPAVTVQLLTHDSFAVSDDVLGAFTAETGITIEVVTAGDAGQMVNQAVLTSGNPLGDVLYGVDNTFLSRALEADVFDPYTPNRISAVRVDIDPDTVGQEQHHVVPVDFGDVCLNVDRSMIADDAWPATLRDLTDERFRSALVVENPATSSPGLAFLLATIAEFGEDGDYTWLDFWADLVANDVEVASDWTDAYYGSFSASGGDRPLVVSYASSPPAEVFFADPPVDEAPTATIEAGCFRQIEYAGVLRGTDQPEAARKVIDFLLSVEFQEDIPLNMFVFPVVGDADLPEVFSEHATIPADPATMSPADIDANRERWIEEWEAVVLR